MSQNIKRGWGALLELKQEMKKSSSLKQTGLIPLEDFFKKDLLAAMQISPDGKRLAFLKAYKNRYNIYIQELGDPQSEKQITSQTERGIHQFFWKGNNSLIFLRDFDGDENDHIFHIFADGRGKKDLTPFKGAKAYLIDDLDGIDEGHILIGANQRDKRAFDAYRLNIKTGEMKMTAQNPGHYFRWGADHKGCLRWAVSYKGLEHSLYYRESEGEDFQKIKSWSAKGANSFCPLFFTFDNKQLYALSNLDRDKASAVIFDPKEKKTLSTVFSHPEADVDGLTYSKKRQRLLTAYYTTWKTEHHFFDPEFKKTALDIESQALGQKISLFKGSIDWYGWSLSLTCLRSNKEEDLIAVRSFSDRNPGAYWLYDAKSKALKKISQSRPWIKESQMAEMKPIRYKSRDRLKINGYLTLPQSASNKKPPLVVFPHGGPVARDVWGYDPDVQFFANRGYATLQMNFRGSSGYGKSFVSAGFKQSGKKMQDDITDGVLHLIEQGLVDKDKVAIYGISYGGYAVLAGLAFTPDLYACGIDYVGISNLITMLKDMPPYWEQVKEQWHELFGHPEKDKELLKAASPLFHVDKIKAPLFVVQGAKDPRVKQQESDQIVSALEKRGVKVPYLLKENEGHGFRLEENVLELYGLIEVFLKKHLQ